jgi:hypothetical protein
LKKDKGKAASLVPSNTSMEYRTKCITFVKSLPTSVVLIKRAFPYNRYATICMYLMQFEMLLFGLASNLTLVNEPKFGLDLRRKGSLEGRQSKSSFSCPTYIYGI